jgi:hypothetical protein
MASTHDQARAFYDLLATRIELVLRDVDNPHLYGENLRCAEITAYTPGLEPVTVTLWKGEATDLGKALINAFVGTDDAGYPPDATDEAS